MLPILLTQLLPILFLLGGMVVAAPGADPNAPVPLAQAADSSSGAQPAADWQPVLPGVRTFALAADPSDPTRLYAAGNPGPGNLANVYASQDGGDTWTIVTDPPGYIIIDGLWIPISAFVSLAVGSDGTLYLADDERGIRKSSDGGASWQAVYEAGGIGGITADADDPANVYAVRRGVGGGSAFLVSSDRGATWTSWPVSIRFYAQEIALGWEAGVLYLGGGDGIVRTTDFGETWTSLKVPPSVLQLATNPARPGQLFAVVSATVVGANGLANGLWISDDAGETWTVRTEPRFIHRFALDPRDSSGATFAFSAGNRGVEAPVPENIYWTTDRGASWRPLGALPTRPGAVVPNEMVIAGDRLFAATNSGLWATPLPALP